MSYKPFTLSLLNGAPREASSQLASWRLGGIAALRIAFGCVWAIDAWNGATTRPPSRIAPMCNFFMLCLLRLIAESTPDRLLKFPDKWPTPPRHRHIIALPRHIWAGGDQASSRWRLIASSFHAMPLPGRSGTTRWPASSLNVSARMGSAQSCHSSQCAVSVMRMRCAETSG